LFSSIENRNAVATLVLVQVACAINWYSVSSVFYLIAIDFHQNVAGLGVATSSFVLGVAVFQLPAGIVAARFGPRRALIFSTFLIAATSILIGFANEVALLIVLRFIEGIGEAFVFGPGVILIMRFFKKGSEGVGIGFFGGAFDLGGIIGISGWAILGEVVGWRASVVIGGLTAVVACILLVLTIPKDPVIGAISIRLSELKGILLNRGLLILSAGLAVSSMAFGMNSYFMVYYLKESLGASVALAGAIGGIMLVSSVIASPYIGRRFDKSPSPKRALIALCLAASAGVAVNWFTSIYTAGLSGLILGVSTAGSYIYALGIARVIGGARKEYEALGISWINTIGFMGGVIMPLIFAGIAASFTYSLAWVIGGVIVLGFTIPLFALRSEAGT
jgi:MFS family permease